MAFELHTIRRGAGNRGHINLMGNSRGRGGGGFLNESEFGVNMYGKFSSLIYYVRIDH